MKVEAHHHLEAVTDETCQAVKMALSVPLVWSRFVFYLTNRSTGTCRPKWPLTANISRGQGQWSTAGATTIRNSTVQGTRQPENKLWPVVKRRQVGPVAAPPITFFLCK